MTASSSLEINLADSLSADRIIPALQAEGFAEAIAELCEQLDALGIVPRDSRGSILAALLEKEHQHGTAIGSGVAIPHCYSDAVQETVFLFGRSLKGINYSAPDDEPVHFILLYLVPADRHLLHLQTLRAVAQNFLSTKLRHQLLEAADAEQILAVFRKFAEK